MDSLSLILIKEDWKAIYEKYYAKTCKNFLVNHISHKQKCIKVINKMFTWIKHIPKEYWCEYYIKVVLKIETLYFYYNVQHSKENKSDK